MGAYVCVYVCISQKKTGMPKTFEVFVPVTDIIDAIFEMSVNSKILLERVKILEISVGDELDNNLKIILLMLVSYVSLDCQYKKILCLF